MFPDEPESFTIYLRACIEDWGKNIMKKHDQIYRNRFWGKYVGLYIYEIDIGRIYTIDDEDIQFVKKYGYALIGNP